MTRGHFGGCHASRAATGLGLLLCMAALYVAQAGPSITYSASLVDLTVLTSGASALCRSSPAMKVWDGNVQLAVKGIAASGWGTDGTLTHLTSIKTDGGCADGAGDGNGILLVPQGCADACTNSTSCHNFQAMSWNKCSLKHQRTRTEITYSYSDRKLYVSINGGAPVVTDWPEEQQMKRRLKGTVSSSGTATMGSTQSQITHS